MYKKSLAILILTLFTICGYAQSHKIKIKSDGMKASNYLQMDDFYLTHYLYIDLFLRESLFVDASKEDVSAILEAIKKYVSEGNSLEIEIEKPGKTNYKIKVGILKKEDGTELLIAFTNWNSKKKKFEKEIKMENDSYTRWYFLNGNKMTYRKDMSQENNYSDMTKVDIVNAYLFDELIENDFKIKTIIEDILEEENVDIKDKLMTNLLLLKYYLFKGENEKLKKQVDYFRTELAIHGLQQNLKGIEMAFKATEFQIDLMLLQ